MVQKGASVLFQVDAAAERAAYSLNHSQPGTADRDVEVRRTPFQSTPVMRERNGPGSDDRANGWEFSAAIHAWANRGPAALVGIVVDDYVTERPPVGELLVAFGRFIRRLLDNYDP